MLTEEEGVRRNELTVDIAQVRSSLLGYYSRGLIKTRDGQTCRDEMMKKQVFSSVEAAFMGSFLTAISPLLFLACQSLRS